MNEFMRFSNINRESLDFFNVKYDENNLSNVIEEVNNQRGLFINDKFKPLYSYYVKQGINFVEFNDLEFHFTFEILKYIKYLKNNKLRNKNGE